MLVRLFPFYYFVILTSIYGLLCDSHTDRINLDEYTMEEKIQMDTLWFDMVCEELETIKNGVTVLIDMKGYHLSSFCFKTFVLPYNLTFLIIV